MQQQSSNLDSVPLSSIPTDAKCACTTCRGAGKHLGANRPWVVYWRVGLQIQTCGGVPDAYMGHHRVGLKSSCKSGNWQLESGSSGHAQNGWRAEGGQAQLGRN